MPASHGTVAGPFPARLVPGGRFWLTGAKASAVGAGPHHLSVGGLAAPIVFSAPDRLAAECPDEAQGPSKVELSWEKGHALDAEVGVPVATGVHQVDSPVFDDRGNLYLTYSGSRGQQATVSLFRVSPQGVREPFAGGIVNATSLAVGPNGHLYVSSRFDGTVHRVFEDGRHEIVGSDLGRACGLAFGPDGMLYVGDRSGTIFALDLQASVTRILATLPPSVAAFHLAMGRDDALYVTGPTLASYDFIYRVELNGRVARLTSTFGRPQGLAIDADGSVYVTEALAGGSGVYRLVGDKRRELVVAGRGLIGCAFGPERQFVVCSNDTAYRFRGRFE